MDARTFLDDAGRAAVAASVAAAEKRTCAEVACVVATESGRYDRAESFVGLVCGLAGLAAADAVWSALVEPSSWDAHVPIAAQAAGVVAGFALGMLLASFVHPVRRVAVAKDEMDAEVARSAAAAFARLRVGATKGRVGVLVYVSLFERQVVVLVDDAVRAAAGGDFAAKLCAQAVRGLAAGGRGEVLAGLVEAAADALAPNLPPVPRDADELPDRVVILHPR